MHSHPATLEGGALEEDEYSQEEAGLGGGEGWGRVC